MKKNTVKILALALSALFLASCAPAAVIPPKTDGTAKTAEAQTGSPVTAPENEKEEIQEWPFEVVNGDKGSEYIEALDIPYKLKPDEKTWNVGDGYDVLRNDYPMTDGSLIMKDYEAAIKSVLYGISLEEARETISYSGTFFNNLSGYDPQRHPEEGLKNFIFGTRLTKEQKNWLSRVSEKDGVYIKDIEVPLTVSALYIGVSASNPVEGLTSRQFKDIVSGKITNWKDVGGNDEKIVFYGTGEQTLTQNYLDELTGEKRGKIRLADDPAELREDPNALFCTLYTFTSEDRLLKDGVKYISIDGVFPSRESASDKSYPFLSSNCLIYVDSTSPYVGQYIEFALKNEVREAAAKAGYVTYIPTDFVFESENEKPAELFGGVGTGKVPDGAVLDSEDRKLISYTNDFSIIKSDSLRTEMIAFTEENLKKITDNVRACIIKSSNMNDPAGEGSELSPIPKPIGYRIYVLN
ncbi:MAG: substrate-binding domain-containing protein, partial [Clostridia bacterium]|nr:substrate-binding domain-containing protein [Clostridia bacterium]